jgi:DNA-binding NtrC family response regulator
VNKILIIDDDIAVTNYFKVFLMQNELSESTVVNDSRRVIDILSEETFDVILLDMDMPEVSGMDILKGMKSLGIRTPVIILTGVNDVDMAVSAMKMGVFDYLIKPIDEDDLLEVLYSAIEQSTLNESIDKLPSSLRREDLVHGEAFSNFLTQDRDMVRLLHKVEKMASTDLVINIWGEWGTGKEELARAIHRASPRRNGSFVAIDAMAYDAEKFAALLFGQARDWSGRWEASPGFLEEAAGGTLFLDDIDVFPLPIQVKLHRVIQSGEFHRESSARVRKVDVRFITTSLHNPANYADRENVSRDLFSHLLANSIYIPPLRERKEDIPLLAQYFLQSELERARKGFKKLAAEFVEMLMRYSFPENVQELRTIIAAVVMNEEGGTITADSLSPAMRNKIESGGEKSEWQEFVPVTLEEMKRRHVMRMLSFFDNDYEKTAARLGISQEEMQSILNP